MKGFVDWAGRYCRIFAITSPEGMASIQALQHVFDLAGFTAVELEAATDHLATHAPSLGRHEHRVAIRDAVLRARVSAVDRANAKMELSREVCPKCHGTAVVTVPHPRSLSDGVWDGSATMGMRYTAGVACSCASGQRRYDSTGRETSDGRLLPKMQRLGDYEALNPHWQEQMETMQAEQQAGAAADQLHKTKK